MSLNGGALQCALFNHKSTCKNLSVCTETCTGKSCALVYINSLGKLPQVVAYCQPVRCTKMEDDKDECHLKHLKIVGENRDMHMCCCTGFECNRNYVLNATKMQRPPLTPITSTTSKFSP